MDGVGGGETPARWRLFRGPGRTEIAGNHTDHNHGRVLVGTLTADIIAAVRPREDRRVRIADESGVLVDIDISDLAPQASERESSAALVRGVAAGLDEAGVRAHRRVRCTYRHYPTDWGRVEFIGGVRIPGGGDTARPGGKPRHRIAAARSGHAGKNRAVRREYLLWKAQRTRRPAGLPRGGRHGN